MSAAVISIPVDDIVAGNNDRKTFNTVELETLGRSIVRSGQIQPITVVETADGYRIVAGERRWRSCVHVGLPTVDAIVKPLDPTQEADVMLAENTGRVDLNPVEEGAAYAARLDAGQTVAHVAEVAGVPESRVSARVRCHRQLGPTAKEAYALGAISHQHAQEICRLDHARQQVVVRAMMEGSLTVKQLRCLIRRQAEAQNLEAEAGFLSVEDFTVEVMAVAAAPKQAPLSRSDIESLLGECLEALGDGHPLAARIVETCRVVGSAHITS